MRLEVRSGDDGWREVAPLMGVVYPPEVLATIVWREVTWAHAHHWVLLHDQGRLVSAAGMYLREALHDGMATRIGGIGGVMTHPQHRARGHATSALSHAETLFGHLGVDFSLLFCEPKNIPFYAGLGWRVFHGEVIVEQPGGRGPFTVTAAMVRAVLQRAPSDGIIDLCGLPW